MQPWAERFYKSGTWQACRRAYAQSRGGLCERCLDRGVVSPGRIVHHRVYLTPENITDPAVTLNWDNLELLCLDCHAAEHNPGRRRYVVDESGGVVPRGG